MPILVRALLCMTLSMLAMPALAHGPVLKCVLVDQQTVRCRGGYAEGDAAPGVALEVIDHGGRTLLARKLDRDSLLTFPRPKGSYYVLLDVGPGEQAIVEHDEIGFPRTRDKARWVRR